MSLCDCGSPYCQGCPATETLKEENGKLRAELTEKARLLENAQARIDILNQNRIGVSNRLEEALERADKAEKRAEAAELQVESYRKALEEIAKYDSGNGCCTYGCDTPTIAKAALGQKDTGPFCKCGWYTDHLGKCICKAVNAGGIRCAREKDHCGAHYAEGFPGCEPLTWSTDRHGRETWMATGPCVEHKRLGPDYMKPFWGPPVTPCPNCKYQKVLEEVRFGGIEKQSCGLPIPGGRCAFLKPCPDHAGKDLS